MLSDYVIKLLTMAMPAEGKYQFPADSFRPPDICTSCGTKKLPEDKFALVWSDDAGMCLNCVTEYRSRAKYNMPSKKKLRDIREARELSNNIPPKKTRRKKGPPRPMKLK